MSSGRYTYRPLFPCHGQIRLLQLLPASHPNPAVGHVAGGRIHCTMTEVLLANEVVEYTALSYCWGDTARDSKIFVDGYELPITNSLEEALRHLQRPDKTVTLWVDAVCIQQGDEDEKSVQVQQMKDIFSRASKVIAWLGPSNYGSNAAMQWIQRYGYWAFQLGIGETPELKLRRILETTDGNDKRSLAPDVAAFLEEIKEQLASPTSGEIHIVPLLSDLFDRPYFSRIWCVQEIASGRCIESRCGDEIVTEDAMHPALRLLTAFRRYQVFQNGSSHVVSEEGPEGALNAIDIRNPTTLLKIRRARVPLSLIYLLRTCRRFRALDPRDKVFALLGVAYDADTLGIYADYRMSRNQVFTTTAKKLIHNGYAEVMTLSRFFKGSPTNLPSWVPDWSRRLGFSTALQRRVLDPDFGGSALQPSFSASHHSRQMVQMDPTFSDSSDDRSVLALRAIHLGNVMRVGSPWTPDGAGRWLQDLNDLSLEIYDQDSEERMRAVWRTAVVDTNIQEGDEKIRLSEDTLTDMHSLLMFEHDLKHLTAELLTDIGLGSFNSQLAAVARGRRPLLLDDGSEQKALAVGPDEIQPGDAVYIILGADVPIAIREERRRRQRIIGETYVDKAMDGEMSHAVVETIDLY